MRKFLVVVHKFAVLALLYLLISSCGGSSSFSRPNVNYLYDFKSLAPRPNYTVYHAHKDTTRVYYRLSGKELLYMRNAENSVYKANFSITYRLLESLENPLVLDTASFNLTDESQNPGDEVIFGYFKVAPQKKFTDRNYVLEIEIKDNNRNLSFNNFINVNRKNKDGEQYFLLTDTANNPLFKNHLPLGVPFKLKHQSNAAQLYVSFYNRSFPLALPPYSKAPDESFELNPDTTILLNIDTVLFLKQSGFYHFRRDTTKWPGLTVYNFYDQFPYVATREQMVQPMRYLTTRREFDELVGEKNNPKELQENINDFWLKRTGSVERSKILLGSYFNRVQQANLFFTSYIEGWKTDRGIIYTVYGPPDKVYRFNESEAWIYGDEGSSLSYYFTFAKLNNPFTENDYALNRNPSFRYGWGQAIEGWRNGKVYGSRDIQQEQNDSDQRVRSQQRAPYWY